MKASINGIVMHYEVAGDAHAPAVVLHHPLATDLSSWDELVAALTPSYRVIRFDARGHGASEASAGAYDFALLAGDVIALMDHLGVGKARFVGLSMGGMVGQWVAANAPERIDRLILSNTSCYYAVKDGWNTRIAAVGDGGVAAIADMVIKLWFTADFLEREPARAAMMKRMLLATPTEGYIACSAAVRDMDHRDLLPRIRAPTLIIAGRHDLGTTVQDAEFLRNRIPGAALTILDAAHISNVELPQKYTAEVLGFLAQD